MFKFIRKVFGHCPYCKLRSGKSGWFKYPYKAAQNTRYEEHERNFFFGCKECHKQNDEEWKEMWENVPGYY